MQGQLSSKIRICVSPESVQGRPLPESFIEPCIYVDVQGRTFLEVSGHCRRQILGIVGENDHLAARTAQGDIKGSLIGSQARRVCLNQDALAGCTLTGIHRSTVGVINGQGGAVLNFLTSPVRGSAVSVC